MRKPADLTGRVFGRLTALSSFVDDKGYRRWLCQCSCGGTKSPEAGNLKNGHTRSCGCLGREHVEKLSTKKHGKSGSRAYNCWILMRARCRRPSAKGYERYGGRGIFVCPEWLDDFEQFYRDMGEPPVGASLDRIDNNGPYAPWNCRWATRKQQQNNRCSNIVITFGGLTLTAAEWAERLGVPHTRILGRLSRGWDHERTLTTPGALRGRAVKKSVPTSTDAT